MKFFNLKDKNSTDEEILDKFQYYYDVKFENIVVWDVKYYKPYNYKIAGELTWEQIKTKHAKDRKSPKINCIFSDFTENVDINSIFNTRYKYLTTAEKEAVLSKDYFDVETEIKYLIEKEKAQVSGFKFKFPIPTAHDPDGEELLLTKEKLKKQKKSKTKIRNIEVTEALDSEQKLIEQIKSTDKLDMSKDEIYEMEKLEKEEAMKLIDEEHQLKMEDNQEFEQNESLDEIGHKLRNYPLADKNLIEILRKEHVTFYNLIAKIQETHAPNDFVSAYKIQDRVAYLLNNQTLLYQQLTIELIQYLKIINAKLIKYYEEISQKQEEVKKLNDKIRQFNEYERKTRDNVDEVKEEKEFLEEDIKKFEEQQKEIEL